MARASFLAFYLAWADLQRWEVPDVHVSACHWLEHRGELAVLRCHRGFGKSTLLDAYNAWRYYDNPEYRVLLQSESDSTAYKGSRDTQNILRRHPWTNGLLPDRAGPVEQWWVNGATDPRNASMYARGILSNVTSARADECQNDDVEVPRNITSGELREKLRYRLGEQTHILVPNGRTLYIGTPHTHDSIYDEVEKMGADCLTIRMFSKEHRIERAAERRYALPFAPEFVFVGIGKHARLLREGFDYTLCGSAIEFVRAPDALVDFYSGVAWPERFTPAELAKRRKRTRTINEWDSQYQLHSKPINQVRLDPDRLALYDCHPTLKTANGNLQMWLGKAQIVSASMRWDPASGKLNSDVSALTLVLQDAAGRLYWHVAQALTGEIAEFDSAGRVTGGQVWQICDVVEKYQISRITIETNGIGTHAPSILKGALKRRGLHCGVAELHSTGNKQRRILAALEPPISGGYLWAHVDVHATVSDQMKQWNPALTDQEDDYLDSAAGAVADEPVRIGRIVGNPTGKAKQDWRPAGGTFDVTLETS